MKRFKFSLEAVQTVRERATRTALENYARALHRRIETQAALEKAERKLSDHLTEWRAAMKHGFSPREMLRHEHQRAMLEAHRAECTKVFKDAMEAANKAHVAFQLSRQKSDVVERFQDRQRRDFNLAILKEEQHLLDEMASARHDTRFLEKGAAHA
jgi:flagellar export protein FliJ